MRLTASQKYLTTLKGRAHMLKRHARRRALLGKFDFSLTHAWVLERLQQGRCEVSGIPFTFQVAEQYGKSNNAQPFSPTLDRRNPKEGYTPENTQVVCAVYNYAKMHWSHTDVLRLANALIEKEKNK